VRVTRARMIARCAFVNVIAEVTRRPARGGPAQGAIRFNERCRQRAGFGTSLWRLPNAR
jgi:hypothetical protein